ncbi:ethylene-dependent gravitropism-deficient andyellow-green-like 2 [Striga asiatica]|uniref:Ethylene-dependent gravitropism-deficient andyellow-green-like 2 n=1 Tax=Striga asiatica TaxID=4170 RepID=A0A5A7PX20_STRAF|nr:ethylene-dependent gravitropism-deficient andyellow-green-like 2 [Striga asiatica]
MGSSYTPTYYTSLHESITTICKSILPFSFKKRRIPAISAAENRLSEQQSDNLKWQQESFHQMLKLIGLCKEGIIGQDQVSDFRAHVIQTITGLPVDYEAPMILRDKLIFLQDLFYANCITEDEYHASKRPLLQRLAVQGAKIRESDVIIETHNRIPNEEWSVLYLKENKQCSVNPDRLMLENKPKEGPGTSHVKKESTVSKLLSSKENPFWDCDLSENESETKSILMKETLGKSSNEKARRKPFSGLFKRNERNPAVEEKEKSKLVMKSNWGFDGLKKWMKNESEDESAPLSCNEKSDDSGYNNGGTEPKNTVVGEKRPESKKTTKEKLLVHENGSETNFNEEKKHSLRKWTMFDDDEENAHPNLFSNQTHYPYSSMKQDKFFSSSANTRSSLNSSSGNDKGFRYNPFFEVQDY